MGALAVLWRQGFRPRAPASPLLDLRRIVGETGWANLPLAVRARFGVHAGGAVIRYPGTMVVRANRAGRWLAQACRLIGTPLAPWTGEAVAVDVAVRRDGAAMVWDRIYKFADRPPVLVSSRKMAAPDGGLMEIAHGGLGMTLDVTEEAGALHFRSTGYFWRVLGLRLPIPPLLTPGRAHVLHEDLGAGRFRFALTFRHPLLGETFFQDGVFEDPAE